MAEVTVTVEVCGDLVTGTWCPTCALPSGVALMLLVGGSPALWQRCYDCGRNL